MSSFLNPNFDQALSSSYWVWRWYERSGLPNSVIDGLIHLTPHIDPLSWQQRLQFGGVYVNGKPPLTLDAPLPCPCCLEYYEPRFDFREPQLFFPNFEAKQIIYRDKELLAVYKPPGLPSMPARDQNHFSLKQQLDSFLGLTIHMPSRLDMSAQGLVIVSVATSMHKRLQHLFENREIVKSYLFRTHCAPSWDTKTCSDPIGRDDRHPVLRKVFGQDAVHAWTDFSVLARHSDGSALVRAQPKTGRTHQIRVHAAHLDVPIVGDKFYSPVPAKNLCLLSYKLEFSHPSTAAPLTISLPREYLPEWAADASELL